MTQRLFVWLQYCLPQHALSRLVLAATRVRTPWFKNLLTRGFLKLYRVDTAEAAESDPLAYGSFNEFFTRALRPQARPPCADPHAIVSPVDGAVSECGCVADGMLLQAKGRRYALADLLAGQAWAARFTGGAFATLYLAPFNYHRVHMPASGRLLEAVHVPGRLFSVNAATARHVPRLFARNERILMRFEGEAGEFVVVMVGALNVGSMATVWAGDVTPNGHRTVSRLPAAVLALARGAELGRFNMGSTVILLFAPGRVAWSAELRPGAVVRVGQGIGNATAAAAGSVA